METLAQGIMDRYNKQVQKNQKLLAENERLMDEIKKLKRETRQRKPRQDVSAGTAAPSGPASATGPTVASVHPELPMASPSKPRKHVEFKKTVEVFK